MTSMCFATLFFLDCVFNLFNKEAKPILSVNIIERKVHVRTNWMFCCYKGMPHSLFALLGRT